MRLSAVISLLTLVLSGCAGTIGTSPKGLEVPIEKAALKFASLKEDLEVLVLSKDEAMEGATRYAQGGIASVWSKEDSFEMHIRDTLEAGAGLCHREVVELCVREGPARVQELIDWGVQFTRREVDETLDLHREGGHQKRRILHAPPICYRLIIMAKDVDEPGK